MSRIEHFAIYAQDAPALKQFYESAFGMKTVLENPGTPPGYFLSDDNGTTIEIIGRPEGKTGANQRWVCHLCFWVDDFATARAAFENRGVTFEADTLVNNETFRTAFFNDPEDNRLQIVWRKNRLES